MVKVFASAASGVKRSAKLLAEVNELNLRARTAKVAWSIDTIFVSQTMLAEAVTPQALHQACAAVGSIAADVGLIAAAMFDGHTPFPAEAEAEQEDA